MGVSSVDNRDEQCDRVGTHQRCHMPNREQLAAPRLAAQHVCCWDVIEQMWVCSAANKMLQAGAVELTATGTPSHSNFNRF
jgi:hypothetical protein